MNKYNVKLRSIRLYERAICSMFFEHCSHYDNYTQTSLVVGFFTGMLWCADVPLKTKPLDWKKIIVAKKLDESEVVSYALDVLHELALSGVNTERQLIELSSGIIEIVTADLGINKDILTGGELTANFS